MKTQVYITTMSVLLLIFVCVVAAVILWWVLRNRVVEITGGRTKHKSKDASKYRLKDLSKTPPSKAEQIVREEFEKLFRGKFPTVYPDWLDGLELDGMNQKLGVAFEFQGPQHTRFDKKYDKAYANYYKRLMDDEKKIKQCKEHGVTLIIIDYIVPRHLLSLYIQSRLHDAGYPGFEKRPDRYVPVITHDPYRNAVWESNLARPRSEDELEKKMNP